jgi:D-xylose transport system permease protein
MSSELRGASEEAESGVPGATAAVAEPIAAPEERRGFRPSQLLRGDLGQIPIFIGLVVIAIYFQIAGGGFFLSTQNLGNLALQIVTTTILAAAAVLVLLIAEIDLSLSAAAYLCGGIMGVLSARQGWSAPAAIAGGLAAGAIIGLINGFFISIVRMPSFIVTLAAFIGYQGLLSKILEPQTTLPIRDPAINNIAVTFLPSSLGFGIPIFVLVLYAAGTLYTRARRQRAGLPVQSTARLAVEIGLPAVITLVVVFAFDNYLGVPLTTMIMIGIILVVWLITTKTAFGRHIYAVGGNAEASRRAGIKIVGLRVAIFAMASTLAAVGGILEVSREVSAPAQLDQTLLLNAIAAAVIGGVSLFGGRGSVWGVVLGALVVGSLINGLTLTGQPASVELMAEGVVLLVAVLIDTVVRRRSVTGYR